MGLWIKIFMGVSLMICMLIFVGPSTSKTYYSCHKCRNLKEIDQELFLGFTLSLDEALHFEYPTKTGHVHEWWQYSKRYKEGLNGILGGGIGCNVNKYKDGKRAP